MAKAYQASGTRWAKKKPPVPGAPGRRFGWLASGAQFWDGVFSAKYSWLSALSIAFFGERVARLLQAVWP